MKLATKAILCSVLVIVICILTMPEVKATEFDVKSFLDKAYIKIGAGYKVHEKEITIMREDGSSYSMDNPISARIEIYYQVTKNLTVGYAHHSQWLAGWPLNDKSEYSKDELFIDYTFSLGDL